MIMVRRRPRSTKEPNNMMVNTNINGGVDVAAASTVLLNGEGGGAPPHSTVITMSGANLLDDQYFASPKRKDCRLMKANENLKMVHTTCDNSNTNSNNNNNSNNYNYNNSKGQVNCMTTTTTTTTATTNGKITTTKSERGGGGRTIGVPLATRSQTRTIENFFKANAAAKQNANANANKLMTINQTEEQKTISLNTATSTSTETPVVVTTEEVETEELQFDQDVLIYETHSVASSSSALDGDEEDPTDGNVNNDAGLSAASFQAHRSALRDSHCSSHSSSSTATDNIFLQEPVLTLDIDRTPTKASNIKINKSFEMASTVFSSSACMLNGRFNQIVTLNGQNGTKGVGGGVAEVPSLPLPQQVPIDMMVNGNNLDFLEPDSSSCDSGVACNLSVNAAGGESPAVPARQRKPATPHRIVCPSPIKTMPRDTVMLPGGRKMVGNHHHHHHKADIGLSPRKSPRKFATSSSPSSMGAVGAAIAASSKSRRRLHAAASKQQQQQQVNDQLVVVLDDDDDDIEDRHRDEDDDNTLLKAAEELENLKQQARSNLPKMKQPTVPPTKKKAGGGSGAVAKSKQLPLAATNGNRELTEFFPVRRSVRKTKSVVKEEILRNLEQAILEERADGMQVRNFEGKGRGVVAERHFKRNEFVVEYVGDLISITEAGERERRYALDENAGCYMYYFKHKNQQYCIDATVDSGKLGRLINHSRTGNLMTKVVVIKQRPHLILLAKDDIEPGEELTYDYGDRSKEALLHHPWLAF